MCHHHTSIILHCCCSCFGALVLNAFAHSVLGACCFPNYCLLTQLVAPKARECQLLHGVCTDLSMHVQRAGMHQVLLAFANTYACTVANITACMPGTAVDFGYVRIHMHA